MKRCVMLLVDGLSPDVAERALAAGHLPHLAPLVEPNGIGRAVSVFPSTTSVAYLPFLTGCLPGHCNIPSIRWLDRTSYTGRWWQERDQVRSYCGYQAGMLDGDISSEVRTIFELVPESYGFFTMITRGLAPGHDPTARARKLWGVVSHYSMWHQPGDAVVSQRLIETVESVSDWRFLFAQFPAVDGYTHQSWPESPKVLRALARVDRTIGRIRDALAERGWLDDTLILIVSDHGASVMHTHLDLAEWFRGRGVPTLSHPEVWRRRPRAAVMVAGNGSAIVYARPNESRPDRWPLARLRQPAAFGSPGDLVADLVREPAVAFVAAEEGAGQVRVANHGGEALLTESGDLMWYRPLDGDPLELGGRFEGSRRAWLDRTVESAYPDSVIQLLDQFRSPRTGDLVVVANQGYDFRRRWEVPEHKSGHGSLIRAHMLTPLWSNRAVPARPIRTVDLFPTVLAWLGESIPEGLDGELVWGAGGESGAVAVGAPAGQFSPS